MDKTGAITLCIITGILSLLCGLFVWKTGMGAEKVLLTLVGSAFGAVSGGTAGYIYGYSKGEKKKDEKATI